MEFFAFYVDSQGEKHTDNYKISQIATLLDTDQFPRINKSEIVNIPFIQKAQSHFKNKMLITLTNEIPLTTSGAYTLKFRLWPDGNLS